MRALRRSTVALAGIALVTAGCQTDLPTLEAPEEAQESSWCSNQPMWVSVSPGSVGLLVGQGTGLSAWVYDTTGCWMMHQSVFWYSTNYGVVDVFGGPWSASIFGRAVGSAWVVASTWGASGSAFVSVNNPPPPPVLTSIVVSPSWRTVYLGNSTSFSAVGKDQYGNNCSNWCGAPAPTWSVDNPSIASISGGWVTGLSLGWTTVRATSGSISGSANVSVEEYQPPPPPGGCIDPSQRHCILEPY